MPIICIELRVALKSTRWQVAYNEEQALAMSDFHADFRSYDNVQICKSEFVIG